jgi:hypothetical protein
MGIDGELRRLMVCLLAVVLVASLLACFPQAQQNPPGPPANAAKAKSAPTADASKTIYTFKLRTGEFSLNDKVIAKGFSGTGAARNNPDMMDQLKTGPILHFWWQVVARNNDAAGEPILTLDLLTGGRVKGRYPGETFTIHPENGPTAGESGIALPRNARDMLEVGNIVKVDSLSP